MGNRMASLRADKAPVGIAGAEVEGRDGQWIKLVGNNSKQNAKADYDGYSANTSGLVWGADTRIDKDALLGLGLSATNTRVSQSGFRSGDSNSITSYEIAGYGAYQFTEEFYGEGSLSYARHNITGSRTTALDRVAKADYSANQLTGRLGIGYRFVLDDKQTLTPMLNLESSSLSSGAYTETGADALNLKLNSQKLTRTRTSLGLRYLAENTTDAGTVYRPELTAAIYRDGSGTTKDTVAAFEGDLTGNTFSTTNAVLGRTGYNLAAGVSILNSKTTLVQLHLGYDHREGFSSTSARIKARWDF
jgi:outer membrane autotransporter protein